MYKEKNSVIEATVTKEKNHEETKLGHIGILFAAVWFMRTAFAAEKNEKSLLHNGEPDGECGDGV